MKKTKFFHIILITVLLVGSCKQEVIVTTKPETPAPVTPSKGTADFTKFVAVGNSFVAGMQGFALFNDGQANSMARIMAKQFESVGGSTTFNQPDIASVNGYNPVNSVPGVINLGRLVLFDPDGTTGSRAAAPYPAAYPGAAAVTCPSAVPATPALPAPYNTADLPTAFTGNKAALNNFAVPLIFTGQSVIPDTGNPASPYFQGLWARFASAPGVKSIAQDAAAAAGQGATPPPGFYLIWMGFDDVLLYAATGAMNTPNPATGTYPMTDVPTFTASYNGLIATLTTATAFKGVVGNIPNFTNLPYFYTVPWNTIALDAATATTVTTNLATPYNAFLDGMVAASKITSDERDKRKLTYVAGKNGVLLVDEALTDLSAYMAGPYAGLLPYAQARQATSTDLIPLAAGSILGTCNGSPLAVWGVSFPVSDRYAITATETAAILDRTASFNTVISAAVAASGGRLVLADVNKAYADFVSAKVMVSDGVTITPSLAPPTGAWSEDGIHPNSRGYAFTANVFIDAINAGFTAVIPKAKLSAYTGTGLPVNP